MEDIEWELAVEVPQQTLAGSAVKQKNGSRASRPAPPDSTAHLCQQALVAAHPSFWSRVCETEAGLCCVISTDSYADAALDCSDDILTAAAGVVLDVVHVDEAGWVYGQTFDETPQQGFFHQDWIFRVCVSTTGAEGQVSVGGLKDWSFMEFRLGPQPSKKELKALSKQLKGVMDAFQSAQAAREEDDKKDRREKKDKKEKKEKKEKKKKEADGADERPVPSAVSDAPASSFAEMARLRRLGQMGEDPKRKAQGLLNKLTPENYSSIKQQIWPFLTTEEQMQHFIQQITQKAVQEHHFIDMYVKLVCDTMDMAEQKGAAGGAGFFKGCLLGHCQDIFVDGLKVRKYPPDLQGEELFEEQVKHKVRVTGGAKFIGSLVVQGIGNSKFLFHCTKELIDACTPLALETLTALLLSIGPIDNPGWKHKDKLDKVFEKTAAFSTDDKIPKRIQFLPKPWALWPLLVLIVAM
mmetsp:Transcript_111188/g.255002  ORF Transcript_111188/g.255002 Transcript_111188/m.255002 type:complete len:466 (-) Transcript_111188:24-1421(-)